MARKPPAATATAVPAKLEIDCEVCHSAFGTTAAQLRRGRKYCSLVCRRTGESIERQCKQCSRIFRVPRSRLSGKTNATGNFCSRYCYNRWLCQGVYASGYGSRWRDSRRQAVAKFPMCAMCTRHRRLDVHHIVPLKIERNNTQRNLVALCKKHHKKVESVTADLIAVGLPPAIVWLSVRSSLLENQMILVTTARQVQRG